MFRLSIAFVVVELCSSVVFAQDPAPSWLAYAATKCPFEHQKITFMSASWTVPPLPPLSDNVYFTPWFGIETSDNLNLLQPVNPWNGSNWQIYPEYYQWVPSNNVQPAVLPATQPGARIRGHVTFNGVDAQSYIVSIADSLGTTLNMTVDVQRGSDGKFKQFTNAYVVFEHHAHCSLFPPSRHLQFDGIHIHCDGHEVTPHWRVAKMEGDICNMTARIVERDAIEFTWST